jgi:hypothetical protein
MTQKPRMYIRGCGAAVPTLEPALLYVERVDHESLFDQHEVGLIFGNDDRSIGGEVDLHDPRLLAPA